ncbi:MAG: xanthine dehydrogenase family protein subunit M [Gammaproteobacteria bacterium]|nr:MAG: xanthine dehydrogenase family protein subunit M [Gammaproteobacteria bacterium]
MYKFNYHKPTTLDDATRLFAEADDGFYLSGGQTLIPTLKQRLASPTDVIDLSGIEAMRGIEVSEGTVSVGAFTRHAEVAGSAAVAEALPVLAELAGLIGDAQVRNMGTLGGSVANSDPAADYPAAVIGLGATLYTPSRSIAADDYFKDLFETALEEGEILTRIDFPIPDRAAYRKFPNPASRYAVTGVLVADFAGSIRVGVTGAGPCAFRATAMEAALSADLRPEVARATRVSAENLNSDMHASAEYRANLVQVMAERAVADLLGG